MGQKKAKDDRWNDLLREAYEAVEQIPAEARQKLIALVDTICDIGDEHQVPPRVMAAAVAGVIGHLSLVEVDGDVHADAHFDQFVEYGHAALHVAVASTRLRQGWRPAGKN